LWISGLERGVFDRSQPTSVSKTYRALSQSQTVLEE